LRRALRAAGLVLLLLGGCNDDAAQRQAFIRFLQTRIIDKPGLRVPHLTPEEAKSFGDYARQYAIITDFNDGLDSAVAKPMQAAMDRGTIHSLDEVVSRHADFIAARDGLGRLRQALDKQLAAADAAHAALKQPETLKAVFDKAYERDVTIPAKAFADIFPDLSQALTAIVDLGDFLEKHRDTVTINGSQLQTSDPDLQPQLAALLAALSANNEAISRAEQHLRDVATGG